MAYFFRLIFGFCFLFGVGISHAITPTDVWTTSNSPCGAGAFTGSSLSSACSAYVGGGLVCYTSATYTLGGVYPNAAGTSGSCQILRNGSASGALAVTASKGAAICPANSTLTGSTCECNSGYSENSDGTSCLPIPPPPPPCDPPNVIRDGVCGPPDPPKCNYPPGSPMPDTLFQMGGGANYKGGYICYLNCEAVPDIRAQKDGQWYHWGPYKSTGATCVTGTGDATGGQPTPDNPDGVPPPSDPDAPPRDPPPPPPVPPPEQCPKGTCPGSINGITVCMACQETRSPQPVPGAPPNAPPAPPDPTGNNAPPDTKNTTQSATNCKDGMCTTTTTTSNTDSSGVTTTNSHTKTESKDDFCTSNPRSSMCIDGAFGGACSGGFACDGDAVQCAMAKEQHSRNCKLFEDFDGEEAQLYQNEKSKEGSVLGSLEGNITKTIGASDFDTSDALGAGATCIANKSIIVMGTSILIPFSDICPYLAILGNILMAVSFLLAGRIVMRG